MKSVLIFFCCHYLAATLSAISFNVQFLQGPAQVGTGNFTFNVDPGLGEFPLSSQDFTLAFDLGTYGLFDESDILNLSTANVLLTESGGVRRLQFSGDGTGAVYGGSLDLFNGAYGLTFAPSPVSVSPALDEFAIVDSSGFTLGTYLAIATLPDPGSTAPLLLAGVSMLAAASTMARGRRLATL